MKHHLTKNQAEKKSPQKTYSKWIRNAGIFFLCVFAVTGIAAFALHAYDMRLSASIMPGVFIGTHDIGGKSVAYAHDVIHTYNERLSQQGVVFQFQKKSATLLPIPIAFSSDIPPQAARPIFSIDEQKTVDAAYAIGREGSAFEKMHTRFDALVHKKIVDPIITVDGITLTQNIQTNFQAFRTAPISARFSIKKNGAINILPESNGSDFNYDAAIASLKEQLDELSMPAVSLQKKEAYPSVTASMLEPMINNIRSFISSAPLVLIAQNPAPSAAPSTQADQTWNVPPSTIVPWIVPVKKNDGTILFSFDENLIGSYLSTTIAHDVLVAPKAPRFEVVDGRVSVFQLQQNGRSLNVQKSAHAIAAALMIQSHTSVELTIDTIVPPYSTMPQDEPIIQNLLSSQSTNFAGSPKNRKINIQRGSDLINGVLIGPGEEFSTVKALGTIDEKNGFLPELVILGDKTTPDFGGGLCQVSTTLFRAVAYAGLHVLERQNHSYRVPYYEPPIGFDATIFDPQPDFRFKNDTGHYVLIQSHIKGSTMTVDLWGTSDGRRVEIDKPVISNIVKPGDTKIVETTDLPPGVKKCTERAHSGADAIFQQRIFMPDGSVKKIAYKSHYVVWPAVCLVGKDLSSNISMPTIQPTQAAQNLSLVKK